MNRKLRIGICCFVRKTFAFETAHAMFLEKLAGLRTSERVEWIAIEEPVIEPDEAKAAAALMAASGLDGVVLVSATFHLGHLPLIIARKLTCPILLWGFDELPYDGGKIRLNSVCGVNLNSSNLYKAGLDGVTCNIGDQMDYDWLCAVAMRAILGDSHVGIAGYRAQGFYNLDVEDLSVYRNLGVLVDHYELSQLLPSGSSGIAADDVRKVYRCDGLCSEQVEKVAALAGSIESFLQRMQLDALAVRCWPEFASTYGIAPCASMSYLANKGYILGCEGDLEGTLSILACKALSSEPAYLADLSQVNFDEDYALMWHCGVAAPKLWDGESTCALSSYHAGGKGVTADFVMKSGVCTIFRIDTARGDVRVFCERATAVPMKKELSGTYAKVVFEKPVKAVIERITGTGVAHHVAMVYGDYYEAVRRFAAIMGFTFIS